MLLTDRDRKLLGDMALSHVLSRDQMIALGYFGSVTRANTRIRSLREAGYVKTIDTPFFLQSLHAVLPKAAEVVGPRLAALTATRSGSPRFIQHALCVTNIRIAMLKKGVTEWRFEPQARRSFRYGGRDLEVRPDGLAIDGGRIVAVEADLGNVSPGKFREKLLAYQSFLESGECRTAWGQPGFTLLVVTTDKSRAERLAGLRPDPCGFVLACQPHERLGIPFANAWS